MDNKNAIALFTKPAGEVAPIGLTKDEDLRKEFDEAQAVANEGVKIGLPQMKIVHSATQFQTPLEQFCKAFEGIILDQHLANAYWAPSVDVADDKPPDCVSFDGYLPAANAQKKESDACQSCRYNQFGSGEGGRGKACKNMRRLVLVTVIDGEPMFLRLSLSPTSLKAYTKYVKDLAPHRTPFSVSTTFSLEERKNGSQKWAVVKLTLSHDLTPDQFKQARALGRELETLRTEAIVKDNEYPSSDGAAPSDPNTPEDDAWTEPGDDSGAAKETKPPVKVEPPKVTRAGRSRA